jgi:hypothetical protein
MRHCCAKGRQARLLVHVPALTLQPNFSIEFRLRYTEQLRLNQIQSDRIATLESDNASLTNKVFIDNAATRSNCGT